jgi:sucrose-6-phosphate hydrolase SacC (GH32 family)
MYRRQSQKIKIFILVDNKSSEMFQEQKEQHLTNEFDLFHCHHYLKTDVTSPTVFFSFFSVTMYV